MTLREGLVTARTSLVMVAGFAVALTGIVTLERWQPARTVVVLEPSADVPSPAPRPLTADERCMETVAWRYFERSLRLEAGLVDSVGPLETPAFRQSGRRQKPY